MKQNKGATIIVYVFLLLSLTAVLGIVIFNSSFILSDNVDIGNNSEEVFSNIYDKGHIALETTRKYNSNSQGNLDGLSCPTNVVFEYDTVNASGAIVRVTSAPITSVMSYKLGSIYCGGIHDSEEFRLYFDEDVSNFTKAYYKSSLIDLIPSTGVAFKTTNLANKAGTTMTASYPLTDCVSWDWWWCNVYETYEDERINDGLTVHEYRSDSNYLPSIEFDLGGTYNVGLIKIYNSLDYYYSEDLAGAQIQLYDNSHSLIDYTTLGNTYDIEIIERDFNFVGTNSNNIRYVKLIDYGRLYLREIELYEYVDNSYSWASDGNFGDSDNTIIRFTDEGIGGNDGIDDDMNSDDYKPGSGDIEYPNGYVDDDILPRMTFFGSIPASTSYTNIFWNNYKTAEIIQNNVNNTGSVIARLPEVGSGTLFMSLFNRAGQDFDLKILEFDAEEYKNNFTLLPIGTYEAKHLNLFDGYIQKNADNSLGLSKVITGNEFIFDFINKDYALFLSNHESDVLAYKLEGYEIGTGSGIYIHPIDDSGNDLKVLSNHIISGGHKNFVGENLEIIGPKP